MVMTEGHYYHRARAESGEVHQALGAFYTAVAICEGGRLGIGPLANIVTTHHRLLARMFYRVNSQDYGPRQKAEPLQIMIFFAPAFPHHL